MPKPRTQREGEEPQGIRCRRCNCADLRTVRTLPLANGTVVRTKQCRHCGTKVQTREAPVGQPPPEAPGTGGPASSGQPRP